MTKLLWSMVLFLATIGLSGCGGGAPPEEPAEPVPQEEIDENAEMGDLPTEG